MKREFNDLSDIIGTTIIGSLLIAIALFCFYSAMQLLSASGSSVEYLIIVSIFPFGILTSVIAFAMGVLIIVKNIYKNTGYEWD